MERIKTNLFEHNFENKNKKISKKYFIDEKHALSVEDEISIKKNTKRLIEKQNF